MLPLQVSFSCCHLPCLFCLLSALALVLLLFSRTTRCLLLYAAEHTLEEAVSNPEKHAHKDNYPKDLLLGGQQGGEDLGCFLLKVCALCPSCISVSWGICLASSPSDCSSPGSLSHWVAGVRSISCGLNSFLSMTRHSTAPVQLFSLFLSSLIIHIL